MKYVLSFLLILVLTKLQAQEAISVSGGNFAGSSGSVSYTVGQVANVTNSGSTGTVSQGVQQPFEIFIVSGLEEAVGVDLEIETYPNPSSGIINLKVNNYKLTDLSYKLYNLNGDLIQHGKILNKETAITLEKLPPAIYYLRIIDNQKELKSFKIIKN
jgi:hypothetical protein